MREALMALNLQESGYQGPTGFTSALLDACTRAAMPCASLAGRAPHYLQGMAHPKLAWALLEAVEKLVEVHFERDELEQAGREQERLLTERLQQEPKLWRHIQRLVAEQGLEGSSTISALDSWQTSAAAASPLATEAATPAELPSPDEMVDAVEAFFRRGGDKS
jgi:hypothetical protein